MLFIGCADRHTDRSHRRLQSAVVAVAAFLIVVAASPPALAAPVEPPPPPMRVGGPPPTRWGMADHGALAADQATYGTFGVFRLYYRGLPTTWDRAAGFDGTDIVASFHDSPARVLSGRDDAAFARWFASAPADKDITWSWDHEYDAAARRHRLDTETYRAGWRHLITLAHRVNPRLRDTLILTAFTFNHGPADGWRQFYPGPAVDSISVDGYSWNRDHLTTPDAIFARAIAATSSVGKPFGVAEVAALAPQDHPDVLARWIYCLRDYLDGHHALFVSWFNVNVNLDAYVAGPDGWGSWRLTQRAPIAALRDVLHASNPDPDPPCINVAICPVGVPPLPVPGGAGVVAGSSDAGLNTDIPVSG